MNLKKLMGNKKVAYVIFLTGVLKPLYRLT